MKTIAIIAHDGKKAEMVAFVKDHLKILKKYNLIATGSTGSHIEKTGLKVEKKIRALWAAMLRLLPMSLMEKFRPLFSCVTR